MADQDYEVEKTDDGSGDVVVKMPQAPAKLPVEAKNLVPLLLSHGADGEGKKLLGKLADKVINEQREAWDSTEPYRKRRTERYKLFTGNIDPKKYPFEDSANVHIPLMLERILRLVHRVMAEIFPARDVAFSAIPSANLVKERAEVLTLHGNWQIRKDIPDFFKQNRRAIMEFFTSGDCIIHSYRDIEAKRNRHEFLNCEEFYMPYVWKTTAVDLSDVPYKGRILRKYKRELKDLEKAGVYAEIDRVCDDKKGGQPSFQDGPESTMRPVVDKSEGREQPTTGKAAPYVLFEHYCWYQLPGEDHERPVVVTVEPRTRTVVALTVREEEDWKDRERFNRQKADFDAYMMATGEYQRAQDRSASIAEAVNSGLAPPDQAEALQAELAELQGIAEPPRPSWMEETQEGPAPIRMVPIEPFSHGVAIENPDGSYGLGIGYLLEEHNKAANVAASQFTDSATLANTSTAIMPEHVQMQPGDGRITPGEVNRVRGISPEQLNNAIKIIQFPQANQQLMQVVQLMMEAADGVSSAPEVLSGEPGKANETFRGIATRVEQATVQLGGLAQNYLEMLENVMKNNARLNAVFMEDHEILHVVDPRTLETVEIEVGRGLYREDYQIAFTADTRFTSKAQRIAEADQVLGMFGSLPPEVASMVFPPSFVYEAVVQSLKARGKHEMISYLGPRPPIPEQSAAVPPQAPPGMPVMHIPGEEMPPEAAPAMPPQ